MTLFGGYKKHVGIGDTVILSVSHDDRKVIKITENETLQTAKGAIRHNGLIGVEYGTAYKTSMGNVHILFPTPELWTLSLPHRTQIIYSHDISMIVHELDLCPGKIVLESGTGSGSLTHALARAVLPNGKVHTCEFHPERASKAKEEFKSHCLENIHVYHRDVCHPVNSSQSQDVSKIENGFPENLNANAVILDVPKPWLAIDSAYNTMQKDEPVRVCTFSPCIEQVQKMLFYMFEKYPKRVRECKTVEFGMKANNVKSNLAKFADCGLSDEQKKKMGILAPERNEQISTISGTVTNTLDHGHEQPSTKRAKHEASKLKLEKTDQSTTFFVNGITVPPGKVYGHTGYLTFFSLIPDNLVQN